MKFFNKQATQKKVQTQRYSSHKTQSHTRKEKKKKRINQLGSSSLLSEFAGIPDKEASKSEYPCDKGR